MSSADTWWFGALNLCLATRLQLMLRVYASDFFSGYALLLA
jgi:hypothetical protein